MSIFNDQAASSALAARLSGAPGAGPDDFGASVAGGIGTALFSIPGSIAVRAGAALPLAFEPIRPTLEGVDGILGTNAAEWLTSWQEAGRRTVARALPRPWELGTAGGLVYGLGVQLPELIAAYHAGGPALAAVYSGALAKMQRSIELEREGVARDFADQTSDIAGAVMGVSALLPGSFAFGRTAAMRAGTDIAGQAGVNVAAGVAQRSAERGALMPGYPDVAARIEPLGLTEILFDGLLGGGLAAGVHGIAGAARPARDIVRDLSTRTADEVLAHRGVQHSHVDVRPGEPRTHVDAEAHVEALVRATEQMARGEQVNVAGIVDMAGFDAATRANEAEVERLLIDTEVRQAEADRASAIGAEAPPRPVIDEAPLARLAPEQAATLRRMFGEAHERKPTFDAALGRVAAEIKGEAITPEIKGSERAVQKIETDYKGNASLIKDLLRGTVVSERIAAIESAVARLLREFPDAVVKRNLFAEAESTLDGYRDVLMNVRIDGHVAEVQVSIPEMIAAKRELHPLYVERATMLRTAENAGRELTHAEFARFVELSAAMREGYEAAWARAKNRALEMATPRAADSADARSGLPLTQRTAPQESNDTGSPSTSKNTALSPSSETSRGSGLSDMAASEVGSVADSGPAVKPDTLEGAVWGAEGEVLVGEDYRPFRWALVEADALAPDVKKSENQARDRTRAASDAQVAQISANLDFRRLAQAPGMNEGAPTLAPDGRIIGGNARSLAIQRAYELDTAADYRARLEAAAAQFGLDPATVVGMEAPALVRVLQGEVDVRKAAIASNEGGGLAMSLLERAPVDAERLPPIDDFDVPDSGDLNAAGNRSIIMGWVARFPGPEQAALVDASGALSQEGMLRLKNAVLFKAYGDSPTLARLVELTDPGVKNVGNALVKAGPPVASARDAIARGNLHDVDITPDLLAAVEKIGQLRTEGTKVDDFLAQGELLGASLSPEATRVLVYLGENLRSAKRMADLVAAYFRRLESAGNPKEGDFFGGGVPTKAGLLEGAIRDVEAPADPTLGLFGGDDFPGTVQAPRSSAQAHYKANGRVHDAEAAPEALNAAATCEAT